MQAVFIGKKLQFWKTHRKETEVFGNCRESSHLFLLTNLFLLFQQAFTFVHVFLLQSLKKLLAVSNKYWPFFSSFALKNRHMKCQADCWLPQVSSFFQTSAQICWLFTGDGDGCASLGKPEPTVFSHDAHVNFVLIFNSSLLLDSTIWSQHLR